MIGSEEFSEGKSSRVISDDEARGDAFDLGDGEGAAVGRGNRWNERDDAVVANCRKARRPA